MNLLLDEHIWPGIAAMIKAMLPEVQIESIHDFRGGRFMNCEDSIILRECLNGNWILVTFDVNTIPALLVDMAINQDDHAGVVFVSSKSFVQNDHSGLAKALVELARAEFDAEWKNRVLFLSKL